MRQFTFVVLAFGIAWVIPGFVIYKAAEAGTPSLAILAFIFSILISVVIGKAAEQV